MQSIICATSSKPSQAKQTWLHNPKTSARARPGHHPSIHPSTPLFISLTHSLTRSIVPSLTRPINYYSRPHPSQHHKSLLHTPPPPLPCAANFFAVCLFACLLASSWVSISIHGELRQQSISTTCLDMDCNCGTLTTKMGKRVAIPETKRLKLTNERMRERKRKKIKEKQRRSNQKEEEKESASEQTSCMNCGTQQQQRQTSAASRPSSRAKQQLEGERPIHQPLLKKESLARMDRFKDRYIYSRASENLWKLHLHRQLQRRPPRSAAQRTAQAPCLLTYLGVPQTSFGLGGGRQRSIDRRIDGLIARMSELGCLIWFDCFDFDFDFVLFELRFFLSRTTMTFLPQTVATAPHWPWYDWVGTSYAKPSNALGRKVGTPQ